MPAISGATVDIVGTATHWALTNNASPGVLIATGALASPLPVSTNGTFDLAAIGITKRDAT